MVRQSLVFTFILLFIASCVPKPASEKAKCGTGEVFEEVSRSCVADTTERMPVATTTVINITEDDPENSFAINVVDEDGDEPIGCNITSSSDAGLYGVVNTQGIRYKITRQSLTQVPNNISLNIVHNAGVTPGSEFVTIAEGGGFVVLNINIFNGGTTSQMVATAINNFNFNSPLRTIDMTATVTQAFVLQQQEIGTTFQAAECGCVNGNCTVTVEPVDTYVGSTTFDYYVTDPDGDSLTRTMFVNVANLDDPPTTTGITGVVMVEEAVGSVSITTANWSDPDTGLTGETPTACTLSNINSNITITSPCSCSGSTCTVGFFGNLNYPNVPGDVATPTGSVNPFNYFDFNVTVNGVVSNTSSVTGTFTGLNDVPVPIGVAVPATEDANNNATYTVNFNLPVVTDVETGTAITYSMTSNPSGGNIVVTNCLPIANHAHPDALNTTGCVATIAGDYNPGAPISLPFNVSDGTTTSTTTANVVFTITPDNDPPTLAGVIPAHVQPERTDYLSETFAIPTLITGADVDSTNLSYFLTDSTGAIVYTATTTSTGMLTDCLSIGNASGSTDLDCNYTTINGDITGTETFYYKVCDDGSPSKCTSPLSFDITIDPRSDIPTLCKYTEFNLEKGRTDCGINGCIGSGAPTFIPSSHTSAEPVIYFDKTSSHCYKSNGTSITNWERVNWYLPKVTISEQEVVRIDNILLDEGGNDGAENAEFTRVTVNYQDTAPNQYENVGGANFYTDNPNIVHLENVSFLYDADNNGVIADPAVAPDVRTRISNDGQTVNFTDGGGDAADGRLSIEVIPMGAQVGTASVTFELFDDAGTSTSIYFDLEVLPRSIKHNGWNKIVAKGIKTNSLNQAIEKNSTCSYSKAKCNTGGACISSAVQDPNGSFSADFAGAVFRDGANNCYYATAAGTSNWVSFNSFCNITEVPITGPNNRSISNGDTYCGSSTVSSSSAGCIGSGDPDAVPTSPEGTVLEGTTYYNTGTVIDGEKCWIYKEGNWRKYRSTSEITIGWEAFTVTGAGAISGHNIYRRVAGTKFDYNQPINISPISAFTFEFSDNGTNSKEAPIPNTLYEYEVKPIITDSGVSIEATSQENFAKVKIMSPPDNFVFAHRWMLNKKICEQLNSTPSPEYNYWCPYVGYEEVNVPVSSGYATSSTVYDIGTDLLINRFEMGCPYTSSGCSTYDGSCIDSLTPAGTLPPSADGNIGDYFYDRTTATCYRKATATVWNKAVNTQDTIFGTGLNSSLNNGSDGGLGTAAYLPPVANISATNAETTCNNLTLGEPIAGINNSGVLTTSPAFSLPSRVQQIAYTQWDIQTGFSNSDAAVREEGLAINSASKCNSNNASGIDFAYTDASLPPSSTFYSIPGTNSSLIRSVYTGSNETRLCESFVGVQDAIGNVGEWTSTSFLSDTAAGFGFDTPGNLNNGGTAPYSSNYEFNGSIGPCRELNDPTCNSGTVIDLNMEGLSATGFQYFSRAVGLPLETSLGPDTYLTVIGTYLNDDGITLGSNTYAGAGAIGNNQPVNLISGGGYTDGTAAGVYFLELQRSNNEARPDVGFRCIRALNPTDYK